MSDNRPEKAKETISVSENRQFIQSDKLRQTISENIKTALTKRGMTQKELSSKADIDTSTITRIINGKMGLSLTNAYLISKALGISMDYICGNAEFETMEQCAIDIISKNIFVDTKTVFAHTNELILSKPMDSYFRTLCEVRSNPVISSSKYHTHLEQEARNYLLDKVREEKVNYIAEYMSAKDKTKVKGITQYQLIE